MDQLSDDRSSKVAPLTNNFRIIVAVSRSFGCHTLALSPSKKNVGTTNLGRWYPIVWIVFTTIAIAFACRSFEIRDNESFKSNAIGILSITNVIIILLAHLVCSSLSIIRAENFEIAIDRVRNFDRAACWRNNRNVPENVFAAGLLIFTWLYVFWIFRLTDGNIDPMLIFYAISLCVLTSEIYKFFFVFVAVLRRFIRLATIVSSGKINVRTTNGIYYQPLTVQNVFILHYWLTEAAENFNKYFDVQIVYWLVYFISDLTTHAFLVAHDSRRSNVEPSRIARLVFSLYCPALICTVSHFTCKRANEMGKLLFSYGAPSLETTASSLEIVEFGFYLYKKPLKITGLKLFSVDLPLLLSIIEAATTYVTFFIQNASKLYQKISGNNGTQVE